MPYFTGFLSARRAPTYFVLGTLAWHTGCNIYVFTSNPEIGTVQLKLATVEEDVSLMSDSTVQLPRATAPFSILVVDDQPDAADSVAALLSLMGYDVQTAYSGREALEAFRRNPPRVVLMDLGMPEMSGLETAALIRLMPQGTGTTIIALTAWGEDIHRRLSHEASIDHHLVKPALPETLFEVLCKVRAQ